MLHSLFLAFINRTMPNSLSLVTRFLDDFKLNFSKQKFIKLELQLPPDKSLQSCLLAFSTRIVTPGPIEITDYKSLA